MTYQNDEFPQIFAALESSDKDTWRLAFAILEECGEPGPDGVRNGSDKLIENAINALHLRGHRKYNVSTFQRYRRTAHHFRQETDRHQNFTFGVHMVAGDPETLRLMIARNGTGYVSPDQARQIKNEVREEQGRPNRRPRNQRLAPQQQRPALRSVPAQKPRSVAEIYLSQEETGLPPDATRQQIMAYHQEHGMDPVESILGRQLGKDNLAVMTTAGAVLRMASEIGALPAIDDFLVPITRMLDHIPRQGARGGEQIDYAQKTLANVTLMRTKLLGIQAKVASYLAALPDADSEKAESNGAEIVRFSR